MAQRWLARWREPAFVLTGVALVAGAALRAWVAITDHGLYWPDEVHQTLEPAHRLAFGYGLRAWEFVAGARHWALPATFALWMKAAHWLGADDPRVCLGVIRALLCASGLAAAWASGQLARRLGADAWGAAAATAAFAVMGLSAYFAPRAMSETAAALPVVLGLAWAMPREATAQERLAGAGLLTLAVFFRLHCALFGVGLVLLWLARRQAKAALEISAVFAAGAVLYGAIDALTWGSWFHSARAYLGFNLLEGKSALFGVAPPAFYPRHLWASLGPLWPVLCALALLGARRSPPLALFFAAFFLAHLFTPHKELRFLFPALPLLCALAGLGISQLSRLHARAGWAGLAALGLAVTLSAVRLPGLTRRDVGVGATQQSAFNAGGAENRLLWAAHQQPDLCGLLVRTQALAYVGGYTYLHRPVPLYSAERPPANERHYNYVIAPAAERAGSAVAERDGLQLVRVRPDCEPDAAFDWRLE